MLNKCMYQYKLGEHYRYVYYRKVSEGRRPWFLSEGSPELCQTSHWWRPGRTLRCEPYCMCLLHPRDEVYPHRPHQQCTRPSQRRPRKENGLLILYVYIRGANL